MRECGSARVQLGCTLSLKSGAEAWAIVMFFGSATYDHPYLGLGGLVAWWPCGLGGWGLAGPACVFCVHVHMHATVCVHVHTPRANAHANATHDHGEVVAYAMHFSQRGGVHTVGREVCLRHHTCIRPSVHACVRPSVRPSVRPCLPPCLRACLRACVRAKYHRPWCLL